MSEFVVTLDREVSIDAEGNKSDTIFCVSFISDENSVELFRNEEQTDFIAGINKRFVVSIIKL